MSINYSDWPRTHRANNSRNANGSCRKIAPLSRVNIGDKSCRTVDRSKFLGMDALDGASGVKEPCILEDAMSSLPCEYGELFSAPLLTVVAYGS